MLGVEARGKPEGELRDYLNAKPCLLVFDNMERAGGATLNALAGFAASLNLDAGSKVIFTLRPPLSDKFKDVREINLHAGLDEEAALDYVRFVAYSEGGAGEWQQPEQARALVKRVSGHPELMRLTVFRSKTLPFDRVKKELAALSGKLDEALQQMIGKQVEQAGELAKTALARLTIFPQPRMVTGAANAACGDAEDGLEALVEQGVMALEQKPAAALCAAPDNFGLGEEPCKGAGCRDARGKTASRQRYVEFVKSNWRDNDVLSIEHDNTLAAMDWAWAARLVRGV